MIAIKGGRHGLIIVFEGAPAVWEDQLAALRERLRNSASFFRGGTVALDLKDLALHAPDLERARQSLLEQEVTLESVLASHPATQQAARALGIPLQVAPNTPHGGAPPSPGTHPDEATAGADEASHPAFDGTDGLLVRKRVRSGQALRHPGHIIVLGDVNPGAQLIAGGDIIVWGKLQGMAHAGALGDEAAMVCALELTASVLRIGEVARRLVPGKRAKHARPEMAKLDRGEMVVVEWHP